MAHANYDTKVLCEEDLQKMYTKAERYPELKTVGFCISTVDILK